VHFTGRVRLAEAPAPAESAEPPVRREPATVADEVYRIYFHGPAYQVLDAAWLDDGAAVGAIVDDLPVDRHPDDAVLSTSPRLAELCFQTAGVWEIGTVGEMALPMHVDRVVPAGGTEPSGLDHAVVRPGDDGRFDASVVGKDGTVVLRMEGYRTVRLPGRLADDDVAPLRAAMGGDGAGSSDDGR
jgi:hypothetical protein